MSRVRAVLLLVVGAVAIALGSLVGAGPAVATTPPTSPPVSADLVATPTSLVAEVAPTTVVTTPLPPGSRGGVDAGSVVKPKHETWTVERMAVTTALVVVALAALGYVYGRLRSLPPKHPDLAPRAEDLETTHG